MTKPLVVIGTALAAVANAGAAHAMTPQQVAEGFVRAVDEVCLKTIGAGGSLASLSGNDLKGLTPAAEDHRALVKLPAGAPAYEVAPGAGIVMAYEPAPGRCEVTAYGPPVELIFSEVLRRAEKRYPGLKEVKVEPGYDPIVSRLEEVRDGTKLVVDLHGAEPGAPGHMFRFSMLNASVSRSAASESNTK